MDKPKKTVPMLILFQLATTNISTHNSNWYTPNKRAKMSVNMEQERGVTCIYVQCVQKRIRKYIYERTF